MKLLHFLFKLLIILASIVLTIAFSFACYAVMYGVDIFLEFTRTWNSTNGFVNFLIYAFQFIVSGFKYSMTLIAVYGVLRLFLFGYDKSYGTRRKYTLFLTGLFLVSSVILIIIGPDYKVLFNPDLVDGIVDPAVKFNICIKEAFNQSMLLNYFRSFNKFLGTSVFKDNIIILQDILVISLYYIGAFIKPIKLLNRKKGNVNMLMTPFFYSAVFVVAAFFVTVTKKSFNPYWTLFLFISPLIILTVFNYVILLKEETYYFHAIFITYVVELLLFLGLGIALTFNNNLDFRYLLCYGIAIIVPQIPAFIFKFDFSSVVISATAVLICIVMGIWFYINVFWPWLIIPAAIIIGLFYMSSRIAEKNYESESNLLNLVLLVVTGIGTISALIVAVVFNASPLLFIVVALMIGGYVPLFIYNKGQMM